MAQEVYIYETHRGLLYVDGVFQKVLEPGRYEEHKALDLFFYRRPRRYVAVVDVRQTDLTLKGQEILTADKVALRVSIVVQFRVVDPRAAVHEVESYKDRLYTDVQLAARRSLASMTLEEILTNRTRLSEDILADVQESAGMYGVQITRADVKDLAFPGNLQEIMNRVLAAERTSQAQLVEARTRAETQRLDAVAKSEVARVDSEARAAAQKLAAQAEADAQRIKTEGEIRDLRERAQAAEAYATHPALLRLHELETLRELAKAANARLYVSFDREGRRVDEED